MSNSPRDIPRYHVVTLTTEQQATLRYLLWNYLNLKLMSIFRQFQEKHSKEHIQQGSSLAVKYTKEFDSLVADLSHFNNMAKKKPKSTYMFTEENMRIIKFAAKHYDEDLTRMAMDDQEFNVISRNILKLLDLIDMSAQFKYSYNEIRDERQRK